ncbi:nucleotidyltransferase domain-containing protein [Fulvivirga sp.]|uniref:nucleotidyltransferase domain-containing protein n=1 Tax=Fulvivirga sp. TaxID=1931237 RepID=UPI0032EF0E1B
MDELIKSKLLEIEKDYKVKILYACESGSRAWGFPSPNSDYDVRFIYAQDLDWHLSLKEQKDTIDLPINDELDIGGWEIKKVLSLMWKSNPPLLEWLQSPIVYKSEGNFLSEISELSQQYFSPIAAMHHYLSMSKKYLETCSGEEVKLKKYFYALRTTISGAWIRENGSMPHIEMPKMFSIVDGKVKDKITELIEIKSGQSESYLHPLEPLITDFLNHEIELNENVATDLPASKGNFEQLDEFYRKVIKN